MESQNGSQGQSPAPDFNKVLQQAQATGDFDFVLDTAKKSHKMLVDFRDAVRKATYQGSDAGAIAMGLNFLENMIANSAGQLNALKQTERATREAMRAAIKAQQNGEAPAGSPPLAVVDPEKPAEPAGEAGGAQQGGADQGTPASLPGPETPPQPEAPSA